MAQMLKDPVGFGKSVWKGGIGSGAVAGFAQGLPAALGVHPFLARLGGGIVAAAVVKNNIDKRIILNEATKEALYQLLGGG